METLSPPPIDWTVGHILARTAVPAPWVAEFGVITGPDGQVVGQTDRAADAQLIVWLRNTWAAAQPPPPAPTE